MPHFIFFSQKNTYLNAHIRGDDKIIIALTVTSHFISSHQLFCMNITFDELREIKHKLPTGSVARIAQELGIDQQTVRNYFGANKFDEGDVTGKHLQPGPGGGIVSLGDTKILEMARRILSEQN